MVKYTCRSVVWIWPRLSVAFGYRSSKGIKDVNKVARFSRETAQAWTLPVLLNADVALLDRRGVTLIDVDPKTAEAPDE